MVLSDYHRCWYSLHDGYAETFQALQETFSLPIRNFDQISKGDASLFCYIKTRYAAQVYTWLKATDVVNAIELVVTLFIF